jgi:hypothetical protein
VFNSIQGALFPEWVQSTIGNFFDRKFRFNHHGGGGGFGGLRGTFVGNPVTIRPPLVPAGSDNELCLATSCHLDAEPQLLGDHLYYLVSQKIIEFKTNRFWVAARVFLLLALALLVLAEAVF